MEMNQATSPRPGEYRVPDRAPLSRCSSCHMPIVWTTTAGHKPIPLSVASLRTDERGARWALNHFSDCPNAKQHRRKPGAKPNDKPAMDLRDLPDYLYRHGLVITCSELMDNGDGTLTVEMHTRKQ